MGEVSNYDSVPYPSFTFAKTSPERLATLAAVNGMKSADSRHCSYLELGCGDGTNLLAHAYVYPNARFLGLDLSQAHIDAANTSAAELGVNNAVFRQIDLMDLAPGELDQFDYIVAHGLFSWVPEPVRRRILKLYSEYLEPDGVGYISYNTYPGCHIREIANEIMRFHTRRIEAPMEKVSNGASILKFIGDVAMRDSVYQQMLRLELEGMIDRRPENIFHDDLSAWNQPFYFYEFTEMLDESGMQYLSEAEMAEPTSENFSREALNVLTSISSDPIEREQYLDFIRCRRFRSTLFCRKNVKLDVDYLKDHLHEFYLSAQLKCDDDQFDLARRTAEKFVTTDGATVESDHPLTRAAIRYLSNRWSWSVGFNELIKKCGEMPGLTPELRSDSDVLQTSEFMIQMFRAGLVKLRRHSSFGVEEPGRRPRVSRFARWQIERGSRSVTTLNGLSLEPDNEIVKLIITLADGTRDQDEIVRSVIENLEVPEGDVSAFRAAVMETVKANLHTLAMNGLLEA